MRPSRRSLLLGGAGVSLAACAQGPAPGFDPVRRSLDIANQGEPQSLDPHKAVGAWEANILGNLFMGLTTMNPLGQIMPGMAERWEVSDDGLTWTFYLRGATWSDGAACNAHDFEYALRRLLDPAAAAEYASLLFVIANAESVVKGRLPAESVGVDALDDRTLQLQLEHPAPYLPQILAHHVAYPIPKHVLLAHGADWVRPGVMVTNGAYALRTWWANSIVHLERNPRFYGARGVALEHLYFHPETDPRAVTRAALNGERGWTPNAPRGAAIRGARIAPMLATSVFTFNTTRAPFDDVRVRQALSMALDRETIAQRNYPTGEQSAYGFVPQGMANYPGGARYAWASVPLETRRAQARQALQAAGYGATRPLRFVLAHRVTDVNAEGAEAAAADWRALAPWVEIDLLGREPQLHYSAMRARDFDVADGAWRADFDDARAFLFLLESRTGALNAAGYANPAFDQLLVQADLSSDLAARAQLMAQAEQVALNDAPICACVFLKARNLVTPKLRGFEDNARDAHLARWFAV